MPASDVLYGARFLARRPGFTIAAALSLALGIGVTTAVFTVLNAVALRPLPYASSSQLVWITQMVRMNSTDEVTITADFLDWRRLARKFTDLAAFNYTTRNLTGFAHPLETRAARVSASLLPLLGVNVAVGRNFLREEDYKGRDGVAIIGNEFWQSVFGGDPNITGRSITLDGRDYRVIGVLPRDFVFPGPKPVDLLTPLGKDEAAELQRAGSMSVILNVIGRLKPVVRLEEARAELESIQMRLPLPPHASITIKMMPLRNRLYGNAKEAGLVLTLAAGFLLLIACANVGNLLLVRLLQRDRELAIRTVLGGSRARLMRQLLAESELLGGAACAGGILLAYWLRAPLIALSPYRLPGMEQLPFDWRVVTFAVVAGMLATLLFGLAPAFRATEVRLADAIKASAGTIAGGRGSLRALSLVATGEIAVLLALSAGAGLAIESFWKMRYLDVGFQPEHLTATTLKLSGARAKAFVSQLLERAQGMPGVESAAITTDLPPGSFRAASNSFAIEGQDYAQAQRPIGRYPAISASYFRTMGIPLVRGRRIEESDTEVTMPVAVVNQALARRFFPRGDAIGHRVRTNGSEWSTIVGVVGDVKTDGVAAGVQPTIYFPYRQFSGLGGVEFVVRSPLSASVMAGALRSVVNELNPAQPISNVETMDDRLTESAASSRFTAALLGALAALAIVLGIIGVYSVMSCRVRWQLRELAVRHALGAQARDILGHVISQAMATVVPGLALGLAGALALGRAFSSMLYRVAPSDPATLLTAALVLGATAMVACWIPAMRAARVDPMTALRQD